MLVGENDTYNKTPFTNEAEIEAVVQKYAEQLFGAYIIYLPKAKVKTHGGRGSIPDGFVIDVQGEEWFIVEAERAVHGTWEHIAPQISQQLAAVESPATGKIVAQLALDAYQHDSNLRDMFKDLGIAELHVARKIDSIIDKPPTIAIPIDEVPHDLEQWARTLRNTVKIWVIEKYVSSSDPRRVLYLLPEDEAPTITTRSVGGKSVTTVRSTGAVPFQDLIDGHLLQEGQRLVMRYRQQAIEGVVRKDGVEVEGRTMSPSAAAGTGMKKFGDRKSVNGWTAWKTVDGRTLADLRDEVLSRRGSGAPSNTDPIDQTA